MHKYAEHFMCELCLASILKSTVSLFYNLTFLTEMGRACSAVGEGRGVYRVLVGKPEGKKPLGRPRHRWEDNIKMDFQEVGVGCGDWMELAQDRDRWWAHVNVVMILQVP
jgi:hypothetical protein